MIYWIITYHKINSGLFQAQIIKDIITITLYLVQDVQQFYRQQWPFPMRYRQI